MMKKKIKQINNKILLKLRKNSSCNMKNSNTAYKNNKNKINNHNRKFNNNYNKYNRNKITNQKLISKKIKKWKMTI